MKKYIQGEKVKFSIQLGTKDKNEVFKALDLTGNTEIQVVFKTGSTVIKKNRVASPVGVVVLGALTEGKIEATLTAAETETQPKTADGLIEIVVTYPSSDIKKFQIAKAFSVALKADAT